MSAPDDPTAIAEALQTDGVVFPRGVLGPEAHELARALAEEAPSDALQELVDGTAEAHWPELRGAIEGAIRRAAGTAEGPRLAALEQAAVAPLAPGHASLAVESLLTAQLANATGHAAVEHLEIL